MQHIDQLLTLAADLLRVSRDQEIADQLIVAKGFGELAEVYPENQVYRTQEQVALGQLYWAMHERGLLRLAIPDYESSQDLHVPTERLLRCLDSPSGVTDAEANHVDECDTCTQLLIMFARATPDLSQQVPTALTFQQAKVRSVLSAARLSPPAPVEFLV